MMSDDKKHWSLRTIAKHASLYDTMVDKSGKKYIAKLCNGEMTWVLHEDTCCPLLSACILKVGDIMVGNKENK